MKASTALKLTFERAGFRLVRSNVHYVWRCPCGHRQVISPRTPNGGKHSVENMQGEIRRTLRACKELRRSA